MKEDRLPIFLDFEASSLRGNSHPIEVAWSDESGTITSCLIRPEWDWADWDDRAQRAHGITIEQLREEGVPAWDVAARMNAALAGKVAHTDAPDFDRHWLNRLFDAYRDDPMFEIRHAESDLMMPLFPADRYTSRQALEIIRQLISAAWESVGLRQHRAANDVRFLLELYRLAREESAR